ncbi:hypothetical protein WJX84_009998, partial [Apatococcus fuscideae]
KGMNEIGQQLEGKAYRDFVAPHLDTQLRLYVDVGYVAFASKNAGRPPTSIQERMEANEIMPAGTLVFTEARTLNEEHGMLKQLLEKLQAARLACTWKHAKWQVCLTPEEAFKLDGDAKALFESNIATGLTAAILPNERASSGGLQNHALKASFRHHKDVRHTFVMSCSKTFLDTVEKHSCLFYGRPSEVLSMVDQICARL